MIDFIQKAGFFGYAGDSSPPAPVWDGKAATLNLLELGDSFISNGSSITSGYESYGIVTGAMRNSQARLRRRLDRNYGTGGFNTAQIEAVFNSQVLPIVAQFGLAIIHAGTNDSTELTVEETLAACKRMRDALLALRIPVIFGAPEPRGNDTFASKRLTGDALARHLERRTRMLAELPSPGCIVVDARGSLLKAATENDILEIYSHDGLHPNPRSVDEVYGPLYGAAVLSLTDDPANRPSGTTSRSINTNVEMTGISGPSTLPTGYTGTNATGTTGVTRTYAEVSNARGRWAQCTVGGIAATSASAIDMFRQLNLHSKIEIGKTYEVVAEWECDSGAANILSFQCGFQAVGPSGTITLWDSDRYTDGSPVTPVAQIGQWFRSPPFTSTEALTDFRMRLSAYMSTAGAPVGVFRVRNFELRELI